jgi:hypothetical protein
VDTEITALASTAAATMVTLLTTDAWTRVKGELARIVTTLASAQQHENVTITQKANASDHSTVIQIAGDGRFG